VRTLYNIHFVEVVQHRLRSQLVRSELFLVLITDITEVLPQLQRGLVALSLLLGVILDSLDDRLVDLFLGDPLLLLVLALDGGVVLGVGHARLVVLEGAEAGRQGGGLETVVVRGGRGFLGTPFAHVLGVAGQAAGHQFVCFLLDVDLLVVQNRHIDERHEEVFVGVTTHHRL